MNGGTPILRRVVGAEEGGRSSASLLWAPTEPVPVLLPVVYFSEDSLLKSVQTAFFSLLLCWQPTLDMMYVYCPRSAPSFHQPVHKHLLSA